MAEALLNEKRFDTVMWGYDRDQVDELVADYEQWTAELRSNLERTESQLGESTRHLRAVQGKVSNLEERAGDVPPEPVRSFAGRLDQILDDAWEAGRTLRARSGSEAAADRRKLEDEGVEIVEAAKARAAQIGDEADRDRARAAHTLQEAQEQAERVLVDSETTANERARQAWESAQDRLRAPQLELERLEQQRRATLEDLTRLRGSLEGLVGAG